MDRHEPQMRKRRLQDRLRGRVAVEPVEESPHLFVETRRRRRLEVHAFAAHRTGDDLHWRCSVVTPPASRDWMRPAPPRGEQRRVPAEEALHTETLFVTLGRVQHHLDDPVDVTVRGLQPGDIDSEPPRDR